VTCVEAAPGTFPTNGAPRCRYARDNPTGFVGCLWQSKGAEKGSNLAVSGNHLVPDLSPPFSQCAGSTRVSASCFMGTEAAKSVSLISLILLANSKVPKFVCPTCLL